MQDTAEQHPLIPAVVYAARSKVEDEGKNSTGDQVAAILARIEREGGRRIIGEPHVDHASGFKGNRGPGLASAISEATDAASEHGGAELWVWHSNRLGRGTGRPDEARAVGHLLYELRAVGVGVRSVEDDQFVTTRMLWSFASEMAVKYAEDLSAATKRGKRATAMRGEWMGRAPDGYLIERIPNGTPKMSRRLVIDRERSPIYRLIWHLARNGAQIGAIVRELAANRYLTAPYNGATSKPFDASRVRKVLDNPAYAGLSISRGEIVASGNWPTYVDPEDWYRLRRERSERHHERPEPVGRPPRGLLARLARCECGAALVHQRGRVRKDGTRRRTYTCVQHLHRPDGCRAQPHDAEIVERIVLDGLDDLLGRAEVWQRRCSPAATRSTDASLPKPTLLRLS